MNHSSSVAGLQSPDTSPAGSEGPMEASVQPVKFASKRIWIDLDNSPHVPFFAPIVEELKKRGYSVTLTARNAYQVCELADLFRFTYRCVGHHWGNTGFLRWLEPAFGRCSLF